MDKTYADMSETAMKGYDAWSRAAKAQLSIFGPTWGKAFDEFNGLAKANLDAAIQAATIAGRGWAQMAELAYGFNRELARQSVAGATALRGAKTLFEAVELQTELAQKSFETLVAQGARLSELSAKVGNDAAAPIAARAKDATAKAKRQASA